MPSQSPNVGQTQATRRAVIYAEYCLAQERHCDQMRVEPVVVAGRVGLISASRACCTYGEMSEHLLPSQAEGSLKE